jgi:hypothetical protein
LFFYSKSSIFEKKYLNIQNNEKTKQNLIMMKIEILKQIVSDDLLHDDKIKKEIKQHYKSIVLQMYS